MSTQPSKSTNSRAFIRYSFLASAVLTLTSLTMPSAHAISLSDVFGGNNADSNSLTAKSKPLPVNEAFNVYAEQKGQWLTVHVDVKDGYYAYRDKLKLVLPDGVTASPLQFNATPTYVNDPDFGRVPVFDQSFSATATLTADKAITSQSATIKWQGCAKAGLCYPPEQTKFEITQLSASDKQDTKKAQITAVKATPTAANVLPDTKQKSTSATDLPASATVNTSHANSLQQNADTNVSLASASALTSGQVVASTNAADLNASTAMALASTPAVVPQTAELPANIASRTSPSPIATTLANHAVDQDIFGLSKHTALALLLLFLAGLGLAFTPCVLPMLPIVANIVARQHSPSAKKGLLLTGSYGLGVATSYGIVGALVALFGQSLGILNWLQNPVILLVFAGLFVLLGLYMLDVFRINLPHSWRTRLQRLGQVGENRLGSLSGSYLTGLFSALVVSPCVSAPLAGALAGVAAVGNPIIGFAALFLLGLGLSTPLILLGATQGNFMPKAGEWMHWVKTGFGLMLFAVALLMIERIWLSNWMLMLWAVWFAVIAIWLWGWQGKGQLLSKALTWLALVWATCLMIGVATGSQDSWQPLNQLATTPRQSIRVNTTATSTDTIKITKLSQLPPILAQYPNVLVDVTATWCIECRIMDKNLFANPPQHLAHWQVVKLDVTDNTPDSQAVYKQLAVFGPPVLLYYQNGQLVERQNGEVKRPDFEQVLARLNKI